MKRTEPRTVVMRQKPRGHETVTALLDAETRAPLWACVGVGDHGSALGLTAAVNVCLDREWVLVTRRGRKVDLQRFAA